MRCYSRFPFSIKSYKTIGFGYVMVCLLLTACARKTIPSSIKVREYCKLQQFDSPINLKFESIKAEIAVFEESRAPYEAFWVKIRGGKRLQYCRIQLQEHDIWSWSGEEGEKPHRIHRMGYQKVEQMFTNIPSAHYSEQPFSDYSSEPGLETILVKKAGVTAFSYALDLECIDSFAAADEAKIAQAKALANYMRGLL